MAGLVSGIEGLVVSGIEGLSLGIEGLLTLGIGGLGVEGLESGIGGLGVEGSASGVGSGQISEKTCCSFSFVITPSSYNLVSVSRVGFCVIAGAVGVTFFSDVCKDGVLGVATSI